MTNTTSKETDKQIAERVLRFVYTNGPFPTSFNRDVGDIANRLLASAKRNEELEAVVNRPVPVDSFVYAMHLTYVGGYWCINRSNVAGLNLAGPDLPKLIDDLPKAINMLRNLNNLTNIPECPEHLAAMRGREEEIYACNKCGYSGPTAPHMGCPYYAVYAAPTPPGGMKDE